MCVNNLPSVALGSVAARILTHNLLITSLAGFLTTQPMSHTYYHYLVKAAGDSILMHVYLSSAVTKSLKAFLLFLTA